MCDQLELSFLSLLRVASLRKLRRRDETET